MSKATSPLAVALLLIATFIGFGYNNTFMVITPLFVADIGGSYSQAGLQGTIFLVVAVVLRFYFGPLADRYGVKPVMVIGMVAFALSGFVFAFCTEYWQVLAVRCLQAVGLSAFFPCATATVSLIVSEEKRGFFLGVYRFVGSLSLLLGPLAAVYLIEQTSYAICFLALGAGALIAVVAIVALPLKERKSQTSSRPGLKSIVKDLVLIDSKTIIFVLGITMLGALGYGLLFGYAGLFMSEVRPDSNSGLYFTLLGLGGLVANLLIGWCSDRVSARRLMALCLVCMGIGVGLLGFVPIIESAYLASGILAGLGYAGAITAILSYVLEQVDEARHSSALALQQNGIDLGIACASGLFGLVFTVVGNSSLVFLGWGVLSICVVCIASVIGKLRRM